MISIHQAVQRGISKIRRDPWGHGAYLELDIRKDEHGTFSTVPRAIEHNVDTERRNVLINHFDCGEEIWEPYEGSPFEAKS